MTSKADEMKERLALTGSTTTTTFRDMANLDLSLGGRFAVPGSKPDVSGSEEVTRYPKLPPTSQWAGTTQPGVEPSLGYAIDDLEPTGEFFERASSGLIPLPDDGTPAPTTSDDAGAALQVGSKANPKVDGPSSRDVAASKPGVPFLSSGSVERDIPAFSSGKISQSDLADLLGRLVVPTQRRER